MFTGFDPVTNKPIDVHETVRAPNNCAGAKAADARLAAIISAGEEGRSSTPPPALPSPRWPSAGRKEPRWPSHAWKQYATNAGLEDVRLHDLRHTAASQMLVAGVPLSVVAERLGCTEGNILRTYRHDIPGSDRDAAALMDRMFDDVSDDEDEE